MISICTTDSPKYILEAPVLVAPLRNWYERASLDCASHKSQGIPAPSATNAPRPPWSPTSAALRHPGSSPFWKLCNPYTVYQSRIRSKCSDALNEICSCLSCLYCSSLPPLSNYELILWAWTEAASPLDLYASRCPAPESSFLPSLTDASQAQLCDHDDDCQASPLFHCVTATNNQKVLRLLSLPVSQQLPCTGTGRWRWSDEGTWSFNWTPKEKAEAEYTKRPARHKLDYD